MNFDFTYKCNVCGELFSKKFDFFQHKNIHSETTPFMCIACRKSFNVVEQYVTHIKLKHLAIYDKVNENGVSESNETDKTFSESSQKVKTLRTDLIIENRNQKFKGITNVENCHCCACQINFSEMKDSFINGVESFKNDNCIKEFPTRLTFSNHAFLASSFGESFKCSCSLSFKKVSAFKAHIGNKPYSCCSCSMQFNTTTNLIRHIRTHTKQKPYICRDCGRGFSQSANLRNHSSIHLGISAVKCDKCNFSCKTLNGLIKHKKKHIEGSNLQTYVDGRKKSTKKCICPICNKQFRFKRNMGMHMKIHNNKVSLCTECGKVFDSKSKLTSHHKACHREPSICKTCGKVFASAVLLGAHEKIHVSDKLFSCDFCQKTFSIKNYLVQHMKTHSNKKQFSCSKCGKLFKVAVSLKYHNNICTSLNVVV